MVYLLFAPARECGGFAFGSARPLANADHQMLKTGTGRLLPVYHLCRLFAKNVIDEVFDGSRGRLRLSFDALYDAAVDPRIRPIS